MTTETLFNELLIQLDGNEEAIELIIQFIFDNNDNENIKLATLEQIKQNLANIQINSDTSDIKKTLELSAITETINEFNNNLKAEQTFNQTKKRELEHNASTESTDLYNSKKPKLTLSFDSYHSTTSSTTSTSTETSSLILTLASDILSLRQPKLQVLWKDSQPPEFNGEIIPIQVSHNAAIFKIQNIELDECWCTNSLNRSKKNNIRTKTEANIVDIIKEHAPDNTNTIRLVNIGSDKIGLLVILSKLHVLGYKNIDIINLETIDKKIFVDHKKETEDYSNLLKTIFADANYSYLEVYNDSIFPGLNLEKNQLSNQAKITMFFAEDLGGLDDKDDKKRNAYNDKHKTTIEKAVSIVTSRLSKEEKENNLIFFSTHDGDIRKRINKNAPKPSYTI